MSRPDGAPFHHVTNRAPRGTAPLAEPAAARSFLAALALAARCGALEVHAFCVMATHYHLLVRAHLALGARAAAWVEHRFARRVGRTAFPRPARLFEIATSARLDATLRYLDGNPHGPGVGRSYAFGSAVHYRRPRGPPWLRRDLVEAMVRGACGRPRYDPADYDRVFGPGRAPSRADRPYAALPEGG